VDARSPEGTDYLKGWFPRRCALEIINSYKDDSEVEVLPPGTAGTASSKNKLKEKKKKNN